MMSELIILFLKNYKIIIAMLLFLIPSLFGLYEYVRAKNLKIRLDSYIMQINILKSEYQASSLRYESAKKQAAQEVQEAEEITNSIMKSEVPKQCDKAIEWGISKGKSIK